MFVVEASSFRLRFAERFAPDVATWLNLAPDHLDWHATVADYAAAKARIYEHQRADDTAIGNADDAVVMAALATARAKHVTFGAESGDYRVRGGTLVTPAGDQVIAVDQLPRALPHDVANALAATATALEGGATLEGIRSVLTSFRGLPHRVAFVAEADGIRWYDDSKATAPHATAAAVAGFEHVVLIAGGRNKGLDLARARGQRGPGARRRRDRGVRRGRRRRVRLSGAGHGGGFDGRSGGSGTARREGRRCGAAVAGVCLVRLVPELRRAR